MKILKKFFKTIRSIFHHKKKRARFSKSKARSATRSRKAKIRPAGSRKKVHRKKRPAQKAKRVRLRAVKKISRVKPHLVQAKGVKPVPEQLIGDITHFFSRIMVCVVKVKGGPLNINDRIHVRGASTDFVQTVGSLQIESVDVKSARRGQLVGLKMARTARPGDKVYKITA